jgi:hypothetical protein
MAGLDYNDPGHNWKKKLKWDVTHLRALAATEEGTFCFDPELSYETTGYRPITETKGMDFDPTEFIKAGRDHMSSGDRDEKRRYTTMFPGTKRHVEWWEEQHKRCDWGFVYNNYRITGDHYFFLNFYMMQKVNVGENELMGRTKDHPDFWSVHYEWFHYIDLAEKLGYDVAGLKARGVGFSEVGASLGVRPYTTRPGYSTMYLAYADNYLTGKGILQKAWVQLNNLNLYTEGGMRRVRQGTNNDYHKIACKKNRQGEEYGHLSQISGIIADKSDKIRGDRTERVIFEESGSNPILLDSYAVAQALVIINGRRLGIRIVFGTGGDSGKGLIGLEKMFLNPRVYKILPYRHKYNTKAHYVETGYFLPAWRTVMHAMDKRGVVSEEKAKAHYMKERKASEADPESYLKLCAEYCFTYEEALSRKGQNDFDQVKLADQRIEVEIHKTTPVPTRGHLKWTYDSVTKQRDGVKFIPHPSGTVEVLEEPIEEDGIKIPNLYVAGIDSIDMGTDDSSVGASGSQFCIVVKKRSYGMGGNMYVCKYLDRPKDIREAYEKAMMILYWYNCKANLEYTKIAIVGYFRERHFERYLMSRPKYAMEGESKTKQPLNAIGTQSTPRMIAYGLDLVRDYVYDYCHQIYFLDMIMQLQEYSYEFKGDYDIVAAMQMCEIGDQDMMGIVAKKPEPEVWEDIGYYRDETGMTRFGVIPNKKELDWNAKLFGQHLY